MTEYIDLSCFQGIDPFLRGSALADGLDRRRGGVVTRVNPTLTRTVFRLRLESDEDLSVELFSGRQKGDLLEEAFQRKLVFEEGKAIPSIQEK